MLCGLCGIARYFGLFPMVLTFLGNRLCGYVVYGIARYFGLIPMFSTCYNDGTAAIAIGFTYSVGRLL